MVTATSVMGVMKMGNNLPRAGLKPTFLAFQASVLPLQHISSMISLLYPHPPVYAVPCLTGQCRLLQYIMHIMCIIYIMLYMLYIIYIIYNIYIVYVCKLTLGKERCMADTFIMEYTIKSAPGWAPSTLPIQKDKNRPYNLHTHWLSLKGYEAHQYSCTPHRYGLRMPDQSILA